MSALEDLLDKQAVDRSDIENAIVWLAASENGRVYQPTCEKAAAELAQLRSRLAQLEAERDELKNIIATRDEIIAGLLKPKRNALAQGRG